MYRHTCIVAANILHH